LADVGEVGLLDRVVVVWKDSPTAQGGSGGMGVQTHRDWRSQVSCFERAVGAVYFDELNELAAEYLHTENEDDALLRSFPFKWNVELLK
jgi:hypothetical protein